MDVGNLWKSNTGEMVTNFHNYPTNRESYNFGYEWLDKSCDNCDNEEKTY